MLVALFPGQGSLKPGMGLPWAGHDAVELLDRISEVAGVDVWRLLSTTEGDELVRTDNAQLATFALSAVIARAAAAQGVTADLAIGHSLGEYSALHYAGILSLDEATRLVMARGKAMARAALQRPGSMAAVLGASEDEVAEAIAEFPDLVVANYNAPGQIVVSGDLDQLGAFKDGARALGIRRVVLLEVGGAFHSPLMAPASDSLAEALEVARFSTGTIPVVANVDASPHSGDAPWVELLRAQLTGAVRFEQSIVGTPSDASFVEFGPGGVLAGLVGRIRNDAVVRGIAPPLDLEEGA